MPVDPETIYRLTYEARWAELLDLLYQQAHAEAAPETMAAHAVEVFLNAFFEQLGTGALPPKARRACLEQLFLLHRGNWHVLSEKRFAEVAAGLAALHVEAGRTAQALDYARCCPEDPRCAALLSSHEASEPAAPPARAIPHAQEETLRFTKTAPATGADYTRSLFRSPQEAAFFLALRDVFPTYAPYPNVALSSLLDFEAIKEDLTGAERAFFFKGTVDCVLCDPHDGFRPLRFFELDSRHHDAPDRQQRDAYKDRILAAAGHPLYRLRRRAGTPGRADFVRLLRDVFGAS